MAREQERRRFPRAYFPCKVIIRAPYLHNFTTHTENISCTGMRFISEENISLGSIISIRLAVDKEKVIGCKGRVIWSLSVKNPLTDKKVVFDLGVEFFDIKDSDRAFIRELVSKIIEEKPQV
jgi:c-di-GMP-binding flagellar brake protein YcgR